MAKSGRCFRHPDLEGRRSENATPGAVGNVRLHSIVAPYERACLAGLGALAKSWLPSEHESVQSREIARTRRRDPRPHKRCGLRSVDRLSSRWIRATDTTRVAGSHDAFDFATNLLLRGRRSDPACVNAAASGIARYAAGVAVFSPSRNRVGSRARMQRYKQMAGRAAVRKPRGAGRVGRFPRWSNKKLDRMGNSEAKARGWLEFLAKEPTVPFGGKLRAHFDAGRISRVCECGCNSFDLEIPAGVALEPIAEPGRPGKVFEVVYESNAEAEVAFLIFVDARGYLSSLDVTCGDGNHAPLPDHVRLGRVTYAG